MVEVLEAQGVEFAGAEQQGTVFNQLLVQGLAALLHAFEAQDGPRASDLMLRFIYDAETAYARM